MIDLEKKIKEMEEERKKGVKLFEKGAGSKQLPMPPAVKECKGHRGPVTV